MATIYSVTNFVGSKQWTDTSAWDGGIVPGASDIAYVRGIRTQINMGSFYAWAGTKTITVDSTSGFPASGTFYTSTERNQKVKIDYTGISGNSFTGCTIDTSYYPWQDINTPTYNNLGGRILDNNYVHFSPVIEVTGSVSAGTIYLENGGYLKIHSGGAFGFQSILTVRDATLHASGSATINFELNNTGTTGDYNSRIQGENYQLSRIIFEGDDPRSNTTLTSDVAIGDGKLTVSSTSGFEVGDFIIVKDPDLNFQREDDGFRVAYTIPTGSFDEVFNVDGKSGNDLYISRMNSIDVEVLEQKSSNTLVIDSTRLEVGEKVVINNDVYTIQNVTDYDYELRDYDFTQAGTTLDDWTTDTDRSAYFANFAKSTSAVSGSAYALIQHGTTSYRHFFVKNLMRQECKVEAWISNYRNVDTGTNDGGEIGIVAHADPIMDYDRGFDSFGRTYFGVDRDNSRTRLLQRAVSNQSNFNTSRSGVPVNGLRKFTLDVRKGMMRGYIDDVLVQESFMRSGGYFGRMGVYSNSNNSFTCTRFKIYAAAQEVVLDRALTVSPGDKVSETGAEFTHKSGNIVVKQASIIEDAMSMKNLAYGYRGAKEYDGNYVFPYIYNAAANNMNYNSRSTSNSFYNLINNQTVYDYASYNFASNTTTTGSMVIDLDSTQTFTHVTFMEYYRAVGQYASSAGFVNIQTSNDLSNWTTVGCRTGSGEPFRDYTNDQRRLSSSDNVRSYELESTQNARYVRFTRAGGNNTSTAENRWLSLGVRNCSDGYKLKLNNVSDFNVGDRVRPVYNGAYLGYACVESNFRPNLVSGATGWNASNWTNELTGYYVVVDKDAVNKTITLDRPFVDGFLQGGERIYNLTRGVKLRGEMGSGVWKRGRWNTYAGTNNGRRYFIKNTEFTGMGQQYPSTNNYDISSFGHRHYPLYGSDVFDGITWYDSFPNQTSYNGHFYSASNIIMRDCIWDRWHGRGWIAYFPGQWSGMYWAGNIWMNGSYGDFSQYGSNFNSWFNYNSVFGTNYSVTLPVIRKGYNSSVFSIPQITQIRRNYANGGTNSGYRTDLANVGFGTNLATIDWRDNMFEYMDDYVLYNLRFQPYWHYRMILPKRGNTDNRLTRFRNEGWHTSDRYVQQNIATSHLKNYNNWGYDLVYANDYTYALKYPNEDYHRLYRINTTWQNMQFGTTLQIYDSSSVTFNYGFEYIHDICQWSQNEGTHTGSLVEVVLEDGALIQNVNVIPKVTGSFAYWSGSFTFQGPGYFGLGLGQAATNGYVGVRNMTHNFDSLNPTSYRIMTNSFDLDQLASPFGREWTTNTYNLNINLT
jgi:hypothetical protein